MVKATHHQRGAGCSTTPEIRSVSQLKLRLFKTSATRASGLSASWIISGAVGAASMFKLPIAKSEVPGRIEHGRPQTSPVEHSVRGFRLDARHSGDFCVRQ